ncbi:MAG: GatB/YqeY domain-containing protein [Burkholderiales bacterium]|nr:GatB/YqeY domain-containing protein [Burkholderiales bacterium]MDP2399553.1 GatB/YqeY domain-containing protein [Burkholderiales bacterium]
MGLRNQINDDLKAAMRSGDTARRDTIRLLTAALKQREVDERTTLTDTDVLVVIEKMIKQRRDSISQFEQGGREDLAAKERQELQLLQAYMPQAMDEDEVAAAVTAAVAETGAAGPADMGKVMALLKQKLAGRADMGKVSAAVKAHLVKA